MSGAEYDLLSLNATNRPRTMIAKRVLLATFAPLLIAVVGVGLIWHASQASSKDPGTVSANTQNCAVAQKHLREADRCLADALDGLSEVSAAREQLVIGDRRLAPDYVRQVAAIHERVHRISQEADGALGILVLPEINRGDED
jgi:hypothetical protein